MVIVSKFEPGTEICWFNVYRGRLLTGTVEELEVKALRTHTRIYYKVRCHQTGETLEVQDWEAYRIDDKASAKKQR